MEHLNPFYKAAAILICGLLLSFRYSLLLSILVFTSSMMALIVFSKAEFSSVLKILAPALITAVSLFLTGFWFTNAGTDTGAAQSVSASGNLNFASAVTAGHSIYNSLQLAMRVLAFAGLGMVFALTTDGEEFVASLIHQGKVPPKFAYGVLAAFHLLPDIKKEYQDTRLACEVRGMKLSPFSLKPVFTALVNAIRWSESVAMAMESKGFTGTRDRTYYAVTLVHWYDYLFCAGTVAALAAGMILCRW